MNQQSVQQQPVQQPTDPRFMNNKPRQFNKFTRLNDDWCVKESEVRNNRYLEGNVMENHVHVNQRATYYDSMGEPGIYQENHDGMMQSVDYDSNLRNGVQGFILTSDRDKASKMVQPRTFVSGPFKGVGEMTLNNPDVKSRTMMGESTHTRRSSRRGVSIDRFEKLVPSVEVNVQNPSHIIPEAWVRGGADTRAVIRNMDYMSGCGLK